MIEVLKQALEALEYIDNVYMSVPKLGHEAITSLRQAISELEQRSIAKLESQEPFGYVNRDEVVEHMGLVSCGTIYRHPAEGRLALYTHPTQSTWVGLTGEMLLKAAQSSLAPEQYDHFEAMSKHQPDIYDRLAYAIRVQDE